MKLVIALAVAVTHSAFAQGSRTWSELSADRRYPVHTDLKRFNVSITGEVAFSDGSSDELMLAEVYCSGLTGRANPDQSGRFRLECGTNANVVDIVVAGAAVNVRLPGYSAPKVSLATFHEAITANALVQVGTLALQPTSAVQGRTVSIRTLLAPPVARRSFDQGLAAAKRGKAADAVKDLKAALSVYPEFSEAWLELGRLQAMQGDMNEARTSFQAAITAEPRYLRPHLHSPCWK